MSVPSDLLGFFEFLKPLDRSNVSAINIAISENWVFNSTIPQGYGLGSSGALSAAAYEAFFIKAPLDSFQLKLLLAEIESFFHGKSSGLDPLTSFYSKALFSSATGIEIITQLELDNNLFLLDSKKERNGKPLIKHFKERSASDKLFQSAIEELNGYNTTIIEKCIAGGKDIFEDFRNISSLQYHNFKPMIPREIEQLWKAGIESGDFYLKLSGAGGGGFFLGYSPNGTLPNHAEFFTIK